VWPNRNRLWEPTPNTWALCRRLAARARSSIRGLIETQVVKSKLGILTCETRDGETPSDRASATPAAGS
jgi:hypothetical protein